MDALISILTSVLFGALAGIAANVFMHGRSRWIEMQSYAVALAREMLLITRKLDQYGSDIKAAGSAVIDSGEFPKSSLDPDDFLIFRSNTSKIGLLDKPLALSTMKFYQGVRDLMAVDTPLLTYGPQPFKQINEHREEVRRLSHYGKNLLGQLEGRTSVSYGQFLWHGLVRMRAKRLVQSYRVRIRWCRRRIKRLRTR